MQNKTKTIKNLVDYFTKSAKRFPHREALFVDEVSITYQALYNKASRLANDISQLNVHHCALLSARGIDSYIGLLAILMAGKIYIPLSVKSPVERNLQMIDFSKAGALLIDDKCIHEASHLLSRLDKHIHIIYPSRHSSTKELTAVSAANDNAYLLFTSGSTGHPKAVMTSHRSAIDYIDKMVQYYHPTEVDKFSQITDLSFDVSIHELFLCWASGGCLYVIKDPQLASLHRFVRQHQLTFWTSVPSTVSLLKQWHRLSPGQFPSIKHSALLGEPLTEELASCWHQTAPNSTIDNLYGPTEATIIFTGYRWQPNHPHPSGYVPIGKPVLGQHVAVLDEDYRPVKVGEVGELYLEGSQVADGYWNNHLLTNDKFITLNLMSEGDKRWYKTGDFVYWDDHVGLIFKGRANDLLKVRGGRIERLEVEMVLRDAAETEAVAVTPMRESVDGVVQGIQAFICASDISDADILKKCRQKLPDYMIPTKIIRIGSLPYNKNGKVDYPCLMNDDYSDAVSW